MIIDITRLKSGIDNFIEINENLNIDTSSTEIIALKDTKIKGNLIKDIEGYSIDAVISGIMILPCSISLKPTDVKFETEIIGNIEEMLAEIGENDKKTENSIDIFPIIWENILMEIPMRVVSPDLDEQTLKGDGWKMITEEENTSTNPELEKLKDLLN